MVRRSAPRNLAYLKNNILSELEVHLGCALDLSDPATASLTLADLTGSDQGPCEEMAAASMARGGEQAVTTL